MRERQRRMKKKRGKRRREKRRMERKRRTERKRKGRIMECYETGSFFGPDPDLGERGVVSWSFVLGFFFL